MSQGIGTPRSGCGAGQFAGFSFVLHNYALGCYLPVRVLYIELYSYLLVLVSDTRYGIIIAIYLTKGQWGWDGKVGMGGHACYEVSM